MLGSLTQPAAEKTPNFSHDAADMFVLTIGKPVPLMSEPEIQAQLAECGIGAGEAMLSGLPPVGLGGN